MSTLNKKPFISLAILLAFLCTALPAYAAKDFNIKNNAQSFFYVNGTSGNVGIGSLAPGQKLDIIGTIRTVGFVMSSTSPLAGSVLTSLDTLGLLKLMAG